MSVLRTLHENGIKNSVKFELDLIQYKLNKLFIKYYGDTLIDNFSIEFSKIHSLDEAFDFATNWRFKKFSIEPLQDKSEFLNFANFVLTTIGRPKKIIEIGTAKGGTLFLFSQIADVNSTILSVDRNHYLKNELDLFREFGRNSNINIHNISLNTSHINFKTISKHLCLESNIDLLFIDADHSYEGVKHDFETFFPLVRVGGIVGFHDINPDRGNGVPKFFEKLKGKHNFREFRVKNYGWGGIGVIIKD